MDDSIELNMDFSLLMAHSTVLMAHSSQLTAHEIGFPQIWLQNFEWMKFTISFSLLKKGVSSRNALVQF